tara:strand:+ start:6719 stop:7432 length:714 start_codon:yes stop_codon:yes gene_type:complete
MNAYISYVCSDNFVPGVIALYNSLRESECYKDFIVLVTEDISKESREILLNKELYIIDVDKIYYNGKHKDRILDRYGKKDESWKMFTKLNIWKQTNYNKLIYLDADTIVLNNIDELFDVDELGAVLGGSQGLNYIGIEAGVLVVNPNLDTYNSLVKALEFDTYDIKMSDQSFLNDYFTRMESINHIPEVYNRLYKKNSNPIGAKVFHFNSSKPWISPETLSKSCTNLWNYFYEKNYN